MLASGGPFCCRCGPFATLAKGNRSAMPHQTHRDRHDVRLSIFKQETCAQPTHAHRGMADDFCNAALMSFSAAFSPDSAR
jgi:hypothetical protein